MTKALSPPRWLPPLSLAVCALLVVLVSIAWHLSPLRITGQALLLLVLVRAFCYWPPVIRLVQSMSVAHCVVFAVLIASLIFGHYTLNPRAYFPYVAWGIFASLREEDPITCQEFIATTESGRKVRLLVEQLVPSIVQIDALDTYPPETTERLARALAKIYNGQHAGDPVRQVDLFNMAVKLHPPAGESRSQPSCELLQSYDISSDRSN